MKEEQKKDLIKESDNFEETKDVATKWLTRIFGFFNESKNDIHKSREKILQEIKNQRGDLSFSGNKKILKTNDSDILSGQTSKDSLDDSNKLEKDVVSMSSLDSLPAEKLIAKKNNLNFISHRRDVSDSNKTINPKLDGEVIMHDKEPASVSVINSSSLIKIAEEKKGFWRLFSGFFQNKQPDFLQEPVKQMPEEKSIINDKTKIITPDLQKLGKIVPNVSPAPLVHNPETKKAPENEVSPVITNRYVISESDEKKETKEKEIKLSKNQSWENPEILNSNLIKDDVVFFFDWNKSIFVVLFFTCFVMIGIGLIFWGFDYELKQRRTVLDKVTAENSEYDTKILQTANATSEASSFERRLQIANQLLDNHIYWTNLFDFFEKNTINNVSYSGFRGDTKGIYDLAASGKSYHDISSQIFVFRKNQNVKTVKTNGGTMGDDNVSFNISISVNPDIFYKKNVQ